MSLRSPLGKVLGYGAAKDAVPHWWTQRLSAVALIFLGLWFVGSLLVLGDLGYESVTQWLHSPINAVLLALAVATIAYHSQLGVQVVVEDYVSRKGLKIATMIIVNFLHIVLGALGVFAVLRVGFGSAA